MSRSNSLQKLEKDAYYAVLRAMAATQLDWSKEKLLTDLRKVLNITNDDHFKFLEEVMEDKQIARIRDAEREMASRPADAYDRKRDSPPPSVPTVPQAQHGVGQRRPGRPPSGGRLYGQHSLASTSPQERPHRSAKLELAPSGEQRRGRPPKRERDDFSTRASAPEPNLKSMKTSMGGRGRGRGSGSRRVMPVIAIRDSQVLGRPVKLVPYEDSHFQHCLQKATLTELQEMQSALLLRNSKLDSHILLLEKLENDELAKTDPVQYAKLLIEELKEHDQNIDLELARLQQLGNEP